MTEFDPLPPPASIQHQLPLSRDQKQFVKTSQNTIKKILDLQDPRLLIIVGPCSIHDIKSIKEYAAKLSSLAKDLNDHFFLAMRVYYEKPRTHLGWKGFLYDPYLDGSNRVSDALRLIRELMLDLTDLEIPIATEFLDPLAACYFSDLVSWGCIGARTATSQIHRQLASQYEIPIAFKNTTDGNIENAIHSILAAQIPHSSLGLNPQGQVSLVKSSGNSYGHLILRGSESAINFDSESIEKALLSLKKYQLPSRILVDCSHDNSKRQPEKQILAFQSVIHQYLSGNRFIRGLMLESHLKRGAQQLTKNPTELNYGISITDPCLDWISTEMLLRNFHAQVKHSQALHSNV